MARPEGRAEFANFTPARPSSLIAPRGGPVPGRGGRCGGGADLRAQLDADSAEKRHG